MDASVQKRVIVYAVVGGVVIAGALIWRFLYANPAAAYASLEAFCDQINVPLPGGREIPLEHVPEIQRLCAKLAAQQGMEFDVPERALCRVRRYASSAGGAMEVEFLPPQDVTQITGVLQGAVRILPGGRLVDLQEWRETLNIGLSPAPPSGGAPAGPPARGPTTRMMPMPATQPRAGD